MSGIYVIGPESGTRASGRAKARPDVPCRHEPDLFFAESPDDIRLAKMLCEHCPVRAACLAGALRRGEPWGVWGGALFDRGMIIPDKRPRGRPRKAAGAPRSRRASVTAC
jgi:WhiB family transcriptional regulator, redox-sensing transcriptional regulator